MSEALADDQALLADLTAALGQLGAPCGDPRTAALVGDLWRRWNEDHRDYHGTSHLRAGREALRLLGAGPAELVAWWFHDAVHHNDPPWDEQASAALAREHLTGLVPDDAVAEVARLVLLTINHDPGPDDQPGQRLCDADLVLLAADWPDYQRTLASLRSERPHLAARQWELLRIQQTGALLNRAVLFHTGHGHRHWEAAARRNLAAERTALLHPSSTPAPTHSPTEELPR